MAVGAFIAAVAVAAIFASETMAIGSAAVWSITGLLGLGHVVSIPSTAGVGLLALVVGVWLFRRAFRAERALEAEIRAKGRGGLLSLGGGGVD